MNNSKTKTNRYVPVAMLAILLALLVAVAGLMIPATSARAAGAGSETWVYNANKFEQLDDSSGLWKILDGSRSVVNKINIIGKKDENHIADNTVQFQMYFGNPNAGTSPSGFYFIDAVENDAGTLVGATSGTAWNGIPWTGASNDIDPFAHLIYYTANGSVVAEMYSAKTVFNTQRLGVKAYDSQYVTYGQKNEDGSSKPDDRFYSFNDLGLTDRLVTVEIHIGTDRLFAGKEADGHNSMAGPGPDWGASWVHDDYHNPAEGTDPLDPSYIKINGMEIVIADYVVQGRGDGTATNITEASVLGMMTVDDFENGCYVVLRADSVGVPDFYVSEYNSLNVRSISSELNDPIDFGMAEPMTKDVEVVVADIINSENAVLKINDTTLTKSTDYTVAQITDTNSNLRGYYKYTIKKEVFGADKIDNFSLKSYLSIEEVDNDSQATGRRGLVMLNCRFVSPPEWADGSSEYTEITEIEDLEYSFVYKPKQGVNIVDDIKVYSGVTNEVDTSVNATPLEKGTDYTIALTDADTGTYTLTIKQDYLVDALATYRGRTFVFDLGDDKLTTQLYHKSTSAEWIFRSVDYTGDIESDEYYTTVQLNKQSNTGFNNNAPRTYYNEGFDVTKPIFFEFGGVPEVGSNNHWTMLNITDTLRSMDYFDNSRDGDSKIQLLFFHTRNDIQLFKGITTGVISTNAEYTKTTAHNVYVELYIGENAEDGYIKINGKEITQGYMNVKQSDFASGKLYISFFRYYNYMATHEFTVNTKANALAIVTNKGDDYYTVDWSNPTDFTLDIDNYDDSDEIVLKVNNTAIDSQYYSIEENVLTIKKEYFSSIGFAKQIEFAIWNETKENGTKFRLTLSASGMKASSIAFATSGSVADTSFTLPSGANVTSVIGASGETLDSSLYAFANGTLTIKKEAITVSSGAAEFIAVSGNDLYPLYVYVQPFADGGYKVGGSGTVSNANGVITIKGGVEYTLMQSLNISDGSTFVFDFKAINDYYLSESNAAKTGYIKFSFYDPYSGYTLNATIYPNFADSDVSSFNTALYIEYEIIDSYGKSVLPLVADICNISSAENKSAMGVHSLKIKENNGKIVLTVDDKRTYEISTYGSFNLTATVLTVSTPAADGSKSMDLTLKAQDGDVTVDYNVGGSTQEPAPAPASKKKCGSAMGATSVIAGLALVLAAAAIVLGKKKNIA